MIRVRQAVPEAELLLTLVTDNAQALCSYETVSLGFSHWCGLFTYEEWQGYEYALDIAFQAGTGFASPVGRAIGIGKLFIPTDPSLLSPT